ncbi:hypothetical protein PENSPDRAFT_201319 [Peniophora sp. CONT]|nr:hypothetical protein PENSPDRAFT_201319 [Peniophora sp. CONT]
MSFVRYIHDNPDALQDQTLQTLYPGTTSGKSLTSVVPPENAIAFVKKLAVGAKAVANASACGSVLAGQTSESDEHEDVGVWLAPGDYGAGHERDAIEALGLKTWRNKKVSSLKLDGTTHLPETFKPSGATGELSALLGELRDLSLFAVEGGPGSSVAYVLLGRMDNEDGWAGLIGVGISS